MEFDSGGNDVRIRTGKTLGLGKAPLIGVRRDSNVSSDKNQNQKRDMATTSSKTIGLSVSNGSRSPCLLSYMNSNMHGLVSHVINSLHKAEVEKDKSELTTLGTITKSKKSLTKKAQRTEIRGASSRQNGCESPRNWLENVLDDFDESYELEGMF